VTSRPAAGAHTVSSGVGSSGRPLAALESWRSFIGWSVAVVAGQAASLALIDAGRLIQYQHYRPLQGVASLGGSIALACLVVQAVVVAVAVGRRRASILSWIRSHVGFGTALGVGVVTVGCSAAVSREVPGFVAELLFAGAVQILNVATLLLVVAAIPSERLGRAQDWFDRLRRPAAGFDRVVLVAAVGVTLLTVTLNVAVYERHPHVPDEGLYVFQARYLASGRLTVPAPPVPEAFSFYMIPHRATRWYSPFPPGWPAALALGTLAGVPWLVNPLLSGLNVLLIFLLLREIYGVGTARLGALLLAVSPWQIFLGMSFMAHPLTLTCALGAGIALISARRTGGTSAAFLSGVAWAAGALVRPLDGVIVGVVLVGGVLLTGPRSISRRGAIAFLAGAAVLGTVGLSYNKAITGSMTRAPLEAYFEEYFGPKVNALGFGPERGLGWALDPFPGHGLRDVVVNTQLNAFSLSTELFGWSTGSLGLALLFLASRRAGRRDRGMFLVVVAVVTAYSLYWYSGGPEFGARYWYLAIVPLVALTARAIEWLARTAESSRGAGSRVFVGVMVLCLLTLVAYVPWRAVDKYHGFLRMRPDVPALAAAHGFGRSLVLVRGDWHPDYMSAWVYNPLDWDSPGPVYAWDRSDAVRAKVLAAYPDRPVWVVDGPSRTGAGFRVVGGPGSSR
jgi:hypothetical protein